MVRVRMTEAAHRAGVRVAPGKDVESPEEEPYEPPPRDSGVIIYAREEAEDALRVGDDDLAGAPAIGVEASPGEVIGADLLSRLEAATDGVVFVTLREDRGNE